MAKTKEMQRAHCIKALEDLCSREAGNKTLKRALSYYRQFGSLTPKYLAIVLWRLEVNKINHQPSFFKVSLINHKHQNEFRGLKDYQIERIWPALIEHQYAIARRLKIKEPLPFS